MSELKSDVMAVGERMWLAARRPEGDFYDPTHDRDDLIDQAMFDHGGYLVYDITEPNATMPVLEEQ